MTPPAGTLAVVLHTHMPYVEGFGTWPFGEEWLWEAVATSYLPLLDLLDDGAPVTLSVTPVLADQLEAPGAAARLRAFLADLRSETHRRDLAAAPPELRGALEASAAGYARALERLDARGGDLVRALAPHAAWTSAATHAILPLVATDAGVRLQLATGIAAHRVRFEATRSWHGGLWLPECAHAPWLDPLLEEAGVHATCVDCTDVLGLGDERQLRPLRSAAGPLLVPIDRATIELVWGADGYPAHAAYRDYHRHTTHRHRAWANDGTPYDPARADAQVRADAADFVARCARRARDGGLVVCALDTELLGHWWHEGPAWLRAVVEAAADAGLRMLCLDDALAEAAVAELGTGYDRTTTWGTPRDLSTWSGPQVADLAAGARDAELRVLAAGAAAPDRALRELLALQSSDWAFLATHGTAGPYPRERAAGHRAALDAALAG
ncbi:MAG TPA: 1,4-alpha-glucan branching protein domain-containing protein, partial [Solirubrobacteraceae bacterium]|nr:1,4-alpha-glucan branching protein domain-containing protein [Solirubrobacteraceae bacterium]